MPFLLRQNDKLACDEMKPGNMAGIIFRGYRLLMNEAPWGCLLPYSTICSMSTSKNPFYEELDYRADTIDRNLRQVSQNYTFLSFIKNKSHFSRAFEEWHLTRVARKLGISGEDFFVALVERARPTGLENREKDAKALRDAYRIKMEEEGSPFVHFDYFNGIRVKNSFPKNIHKHEMTVDIRRYAGGNPIARIGSLIHKNLPHC